MVKSWQRMMKSSGLLSVCCSVGIWTSLGKSPVLSVPVVTSNVTVPAVSITRSPAVKPKEPPVTGATLAASSRSSGPPRPCSRAGHLDLHVVPVRALLHDAAAALAVAFDDVPPPSPVASGGVTTSAEASMWPASTSRRALLLNVQPRPSRATVSSHAGRPSMR